MSEENNGLTLPKEEFNFSKKIIYYLAILGLLPSAILFGNLHSSILLSLTSIFSFALIFWYLQLVLSHSKVSNKIIMASVLIQIISHLFSLIILFSSFITCGNSFSDELCGLQMIVLLFTIPLGVMLSVILGLISIYVERNNEEKNRPEMITRRPAGVTAIAVLFFLSGVGGLFAVTGMFFPFRILLNNIVAVILMIVQLTLVDFLRPIFLALVSLTFFIVKGLWNGKNWARVLALIFATAGLFGSLKSLNLLVIAVAVIYVLVIWYLGFNKEVKNYFN